LAIPIELPPGSRLEDTDRVTRDITQRLNRRPEVKSVIVYGGQLLGGMGGASEVRRATLVINLVHKSERAMTQKELQKLIGLDLASVPDIRFWFLKDNGQHDISPR
jgi:multidrug efflux pump subunit AcrB